jgi:hypothetical protein
MTRVKPFQVCLCLIKPNLNGMKTKPETSAPPVAAEVVGKEVKAKTEGALSPARTTTHNKHSASTGSQQPPIDFTKEWSNGHKFFNTQQHRAYSELLRTEENTRKTYDNKRDLIARPRNPLNGDVTPRDQRGELVMNPRLLHTVKNGLLLFDHRGQPAREWHPQHMTEKIGVQPGKYEVLGNTCTDGIATQSEHGDQFDLFKTVRMENEKRAGLRVEQDKMNSLILQEKAKRYEKELSRQMILLERKMEEKNKEMEFLHSTMRR